MNGTWLQFYDIYRSYGLASLEDALMVLPIIIILLCSHKSSRVIFTTRDDFCEHNRIIIIGKTIKAFSREASPWLRYIS